MNECCIEESLRNKASECVDKESPQQIKASNLGDTKSLRQNKADERFDKESL